MRDLARVYPEDMHDLCSLSSPRFERGDLLRFISVCFWRLPACCSAVNLQIFRDQIIPSAVDNYTNEVSVCPRGIIYDRNGSILARNLACIT
jgi:cell division protein FtsI/penicillin-binding protein 2